MAFIAFDNGPAYAMPYAETPPAAGRNSASGPANAGEAAEEHTARLSALEWLVVALARKDHPASLRQPGRLAAAIRSLFKQPDPMLADARLEALRRMAVLGWHHGDAIPAREVDAFLEAGFTAGQYDVMMESIGVARSPAERRLVW